MALIDTLLNIQISEAAQAVPTASTTVPLLLGTSPKPESWGPKDLVHTYNAPSDVLADGFPANSPEYQAALVMCSQATVPSQFLIAVREDVASAAKPQIDTITPAGVLDGQLYQFQVQTSSYSITSGANSTGASVIAQLLQAVQADSAAPVTASVATDNPTELVLTAKAAGVALTYSGVSSTLNHAQSQAGAAASAGALDVEDLADIQAANDTWYGLVLVGASDADIQTAAAWIQGQRKMLFAATQATDGALIAALAAENYSRTCLTISPASAPLIMAAWVGSQLPQLPGSNNWAYKTLVGVAPDVLTASQQAAIFGNPAAGLAGNRANAYVSMGGTPVTLLGTTCSGDYVDTIVGIDALFFAMQSGILGVLKSASKIPMTDAGVAIVEGAVRVALQQSASDGFLVDGWTVTAPKVANWPQAKRQARICPTITFAATLSGAVNATNILGSVSV